jgi:hypothetical protein
MTGRISSFAGGNIRREQQGNSACQIREQHRGKAPSFDNIAKQKQALHRLSLEPSNLVIPML